jgi:DNA-binding HxlR family transcriptional regulator
MRSYGQFCPVAKAAGLFCERWTPLIIRDLAAGATRFSEIQRGVPLISPTLLSRRLKQLEAEGIVEKRHSGNGNTYHLTNAGTEFVPLVEALGVWGQRWSRRELVEEEMDLGLLLWAIERNAKADAFGGNRSVVRLELTDQPSSKQLWWFVNEKGVCQLCVHDPGFDVDLYLACSLRDIIYIIRGDVSLDTAISTDRLEVIGHRAKIQNVAGWFNFGPITKVTSQLNPQETARPG